MTAIRLGRRLPGASSNLPERLVRTDLEREGFPRLRTAPIRSCSRWGLPCRFRCRNRGALLPHRFTLAALPCGRMAGCFSVALSLRFDPRRTLSGTVRPWSPDFPPRRPFGISAERPSGQLTAKGWDGWWHSSRARCTGAVQGRGVCVGRSERCYATACERRLRVSNNRRSVISVEESTLPSQRAGRKWRWKASTTS